MKGVICEENILSIRAFTLSHYTSVDSQKKILYFIRGFFGALKAKYEYKLDYFINILQMPKNLHSPYKEVPTVREQDVLNVLQFIQQNGLDEKAKRDHMGVILFLAYTGQRPSIAIKLTVGQVRDAYQQSKPCIRVLEAQDKNAYPHYVPLHPNLKGVLLELIGGKDGNTLVFSYEKCSRWLHDNPIKLTTNGASFQLAHLRKFFEQESDLLGFRDAFKNIMMAHGVGSVSHRHYKALTPDEIYNEYLGCWDGVQLGN